MKDAIGTAPAHNPNQEYLAAVLETPVYCEDKKDMVDSADCQQINELYYSKFFLETLRQTSEQIVLEAEEIDQLVNKFFREGNLTSKEVHGKINSIKFEFACLYDLVSKIDRTPKGKE